MANTILTADMITRKALQVLHAKCNFIGSINRDYDDQFAQTGGKIGESLRIRLPHKFTIRNGATLSTQDTTEKSVTLTQATQKGVDMTFSTRELTMSIDDFSQRYIEPAMSTLASYVEADALNMVLDIYNTVGTPGTVPAALAPFLNAKTKLNQYLAPKDNARMALIDSETSGAMVEGLKGLFQDSSQLAAQYREGVMGRTSGFTFAENDLLPVLTTGTRDNITPLVKGPAQTGSTLLIDGDTAGNTIKKGDIFTIAGVYAVHPETKTAYGHLQQFVVTADATFGALDVTISISPEIITTGAYQNVSAGPADDAAITWLGSAGTAYGQNVCYHKDAFAFVSADLEMPQGVHFASRKVMDGLSLRVVRQYDINSDKIPCRLDIFYGYKTIRPELACRVTK